MAKPKDKNKGGKKTAPRVPGKKNGKPKTDEGKSPRPTETTKAAPRPKYDRSHKLVAQDILAAADGPMNAMQISVLMVSEGQISGKTPQATVGRDLCMNPDLFAKVDRGKYVAIKTVNGKGLQVIHGNKPRGDVAAYIRAYKANGGKVTAHAPAPAKKPAAAPKKAPAAKPKKGGKNGKKPTKAAPKQVPDKKKVAELLAEQKAKADKKTGNGKPKAAPAPKGPGIKSSGK